MNSESTLGPALTADFDYAIPVLASPNVQASIDFFIELGGRRPFITEDNQYGGVVFGAVELHFYQTTEKLLLENSACRVNMKHVSGLYE